MMNNDHNHDARISCEETFTADQGPADWANEPEPPKRGQCEDAPCCGCCVPDDGGTVDDGYGTWADEAWHDAQEYPDW